MMTKIENDCCDCASPGYPCLGNSCPLTKVEHHYCDNCGEEDTLYNYEGKELCANCILENFEVAYE